MTRPSVVPSATLPTSSWPSLANDSSEKPGRGVDERSHAAEHERDEHHDDDVRRHDEGERERREGATRARLREDAERRRGAARHCERSPEEGHAEERAASSAPA